MSSIFYYFSLCLSTILTAYTLHAQIIISEVYANGKGRKNDQGQEWFEVFNIGKNSVDLKNAIIKRLDGAKLQEAWRIQLPPKSITLEPQQYAVITQKNDLGIELCLNTPMIIVEDASFQFKNSGSQMLCIQTDEGLEDCAYFNKSGVFPDGHSRFNQALSVFSNDDLKWWQVEDCEITPGIFASPGSKGGFCHDGSSQLPNQIPCPIEEMTIPKPDSHTKLQSQIPSCNCIQAKNDPPLILIFSFMVFLLLIIRQRSDVDG